MRNLRRYYETNRDLAEVKISIFKFLPNIPMKLTIFFGYNLLLEISSNVQKFNVLRFSVCFFLFVQFPNKIASFEEKNRIPLIS